ncbi:zf PARP type zinc finger protein Hpz2 [Schizosaccharomyces pombe]|uniref:PARP-type zinc finger-containing protein C13F5.07c n=1 Tax=Schizosaccharomyces pombe (strain 972 / ATCC 24843) TaxID=284812 RepID=YEU7_SCHPO|nr:zf PARP type zinc finger protein [Schizosaccharomyces pombe]O13706.2 RecName: Full=PARP-type zinc finger-containing protein C13F5.07c [Schizosaccharomyces pombe 972h-]CAB11770.2 zf PARP type zinc finger protein [Schizosaccharomyces pombe]|eukprot:NP_593655.2 zf PARP type zinc finger protein [Schizosaccharomyces pombe]
MEQGGSGYRIEIAPNNRAKCKGSLCGRSKILAGTVRFGTFVDSGRFQSWAWKHWGCVTPRMLKNIKNRLGEDDIVNSLDGITALSQEWIDKVVDAINEGHVSESDERESRKLGEKMNVNSQKLKTSSPPKVVRKNKRHHTTVKSVLSDSDLDAEFTDGSEAYEDD